MVREKAEIDSFHYPRLGIHIEPEDFEHIIVFQRFRITKAVQFLLGIFGFVLVGWTYRRRRQARLSPSKRSEDR